MHMQWDVFISHASEDKEKFVRSLAEGLRQAGIAVWYDDFSLSAGDSLRESIDRGISESRLGIIVFSPNFFRKNWPRNELNGLFTLATDQGRKLVPIWLDVTAPEVAQYSPMLADLVALHAEQGVQAIVAEIRQMVAAEKLHKLNREIYLYEVSIGGKVRNMVSPVPGDWLFEHGYGLPDVAIFGLLVITLDQGGDFVPDNFRENVRITKFLHKLIADNIFGDDDMRRAAQQQGDGYVFIIDQRTANPDGKIPPEDILGSVTVKEGVAVPGSYVRSYNHRLLTEDGFFLLPQSLESKLDGQIRASTAQQEAAQPPKIELEGPL